MNNSPKLELYTQQKFGW